MNATEQTSKEYFRSLQIVHLALLLGISSFTIIVFFLNYSGGLNIGDGNLNCIFQYIVPAMLVCCLIASNLINKSKINKIKQKTNLLDKLGDYRSAFIIKFALLEGPAFFAIVVFLLTANEVYLIYILPIIILFIILRPTKDKIIMELELNNDERAKVNNPDSIVARFTAN